MKENTQDEIYNLGTLLLEIGTLLMSNGASTARIRMITERIASTFGYTTDLFITHRALTLSLSDQDHRQVYNNLKRTSPHGINFKVVSGISRMSWRVVQEGWSVDKIEEDLKRIVALPHYPRWVVLTLVGLAGASFCRITGGNGFEMLICFFATVVGLFIRQEAIKRRFNAYVAIFFGAASAALTAGSFSLFNFPFTIEHAFATSVLFLIPGVPLIHSATDMIEGNTLNGILRLAHGLLIAVMIALGLLFAIYLFRI